ncbi:MAG: hypothetical protein NZ853_01690 [Leptospiraceae bacterium]|nr:hypothetical protein [Leptospiraceae bacterium]MDW7976061.1 hypothetical protein [Leptospiraceae bacterium]
MKKTILSFVLGIALTASLWAKDVEITGLVNREKIDNQEILVFITENNEKYEISGKLVSVINSFYINQKIRVLGNITKFDPKNQKETKLNGKIDIKEVILK